jgi:hypothetical protein
LEETGYVSDEWELWYSVTKGTKTIGSAFVYIARDCRYQQAPELDAGERIELFFVTLEEYIQAVLDPDFCSRDLVVPFLHIHYDADKRAEFSRRLFGGKCEGEVKKAV